MAALSSAGSVYVAIGLTRRAAGIARRWTARHPGRRPVAVAAAIACAVSLVLFWTLHGQFRNW
jgi:hypothetical protein